RSGCSSGRRSATARPRCSPTPPATLPEPAPVLDRRDLVFLECVMRPAILPMSFLLLSAAVFAQTASHEGHHAPGSPPASGGSALLPGMGSHHHPMATRSPEAQRLFDQGLTLVF